MAIINGENIKQKEKLKISIRSDIAKEIEDYCKWAKVHDVGFFIEEAAAFVFDKDKEWKEYKREIKRNKNS